MTEQELKDAELMGIMKAVLRMDAFACEHREALKKIPALELGKIKIPDERRYPVIKEIENGLVFDRYADHALLYYTAGVADEVRCVGRFLSSGLGMPSDGFGK